MASRQEALKRLEVLQLSRRLIFCIQPADDQVQQLSAATVGYRVAQLSVCVPAAGWMQMICSAG